MSETLTNNDVISAFEAADACVGASNCKKLAEAMVIFYKKSNQMTIDTGEGLIILCAQVDESCANQDQLLCQDRV